ncbi:hypothetical protein [Streptomyces violaceusniger]|uniref:hypothetical protein n=1 Tax=Streptomyces violaceusniger TaxID=68280 RepID=UPI00142F3195|nr:hypothetical protein [Streptomyces violaceusniger]
MRTCAQRARPPVARLCSGTPAMSAAWSSSITSTSDGAAPSTSSSASRRPAENQPP